MFNRVGSRITQPQADHILAIVRRPAHWRPTTFESAPPRGEVVEVHQVASYAEAHEDRVRCNRLALRENLDTWAVVIRPSADS
ncbi:MAG: hypothetical protein DWQ31_04070 [Planctomycetota bacterium]|nr:MAG: hypothetical protein DWQ31_04070 [Planctomycetota bacterium]REJ94144.1 MAG: hypothetical protein DWQ35_08990 [Planctomycetota bacterium]REK26330.1 MAG: hypothetical protein DWQ42_09580 [Planctomycetota bacterium]REK45881.1 MAG: hypothetical protein DWQ46_08295 [Planctomycetota bacterium]